LAAPPASIRRKGARSLLEAGFWRAPGEARERPRRRAAGEARTEPFAWQAAAQAESALEKAGPSDFVIGEEGKIDALGKTPHGIIGDITYRS
jgi:hypothetical protein